MKGMTGIAGEGEGEEWESCYGELPRTDEALNVGWAVV